MVYYVIVIEGGLVPNIHGPYRSVVACDKVARELSKDCVRTDKVFYLDVRNMRDMEIGIYDDDWYSNE